MYVRVCWGEGLWDREVRGQGDKRVGVSAQPADLGKVAVSSWGGPWRAEPECEKTEKSEVAGGSFLAPQRSPCLLPSQKVASAGQWNFPKTGSSLLGRDSQFYPHPPRAGLTLGLGA